MGLWKTADIYERAVQEVQRERACGTRGHRACVACSALALVDAVVHGLPEGRRLRAQALDVADFEMLALLDSALPDTSTL